MKIIEKKNWLPHLMAVLIFLVLTLVYFGPVLQGKDLMQGDAISSQGWGKDARDYHEATGDYAYWSNAMFSGMPSNYTFSPQPVNIFEAADKVLTLGMFGASRRHIGAIFLTFVCFYIFLLSMGCRSWLSVAGSIAYTLCSYNFIIIEAGHMSKSLVMATMAPIIGGVVLCYRGQLLRGALLTLIFSGLNIYWSHQQISYYLLLVLIILALVYLVYANDYLVIELKRTLENESRLRHRTLSRVNEKNNTVDHLEHSLDLAAEVGVSGGIDNIDLNVLVVHRSILCKNSDASLLLDIIRVHYSRNGLLIFSVYTALLEQSVNERGLTVVNVRNDRNVS